MAVKTLAQLGAGIVTNAASIASTLGGAFTTAHVTALGDLLVATGENRQDLAQLLVRQANATDAVQISA